MINKGIKEVNMNNTNHMGVSGNCICPKCGFKTSHKRGVPCQEEKCRKCGAKMLREDSIHHQLLKKRNDK
jgi:NAD-dependent SIR2 family protein deacetylase